MECQRTSTVLRAKFRENLHKLSSCGQCVKRHDKNISMLDIIHPEDTICLARISSTFYVIFQTFLQNILVYDAFIVNNKGIYYNNLRMYC